MKYFLLCAIPPVMVIVANAFDHWMVVNTLLLLSGYYTAENAIKWRRASEGLDK